MPHSLRCKIKNLNHKKILTDNETQRIIKALSIELCEDAVSRAEALKNLALTNGKDDVYRMINSLPNVQPIRPKGEWIKSPYLDKYFCFNCKVMYDIRDIQSMELDFCPKCGADLRNKNQTERGLQFADQDTMQSAT